MDTPTFPLQHAPQSYVINSKPFENDFPTLPSLHQAVLENDFSTILKCVANNHNLDAIDNRGWTALHLAAIQKKLDAYEYLIEKGANPNLPNNRGMSAADIRKYAVESQKCNEVGFISLMTTNRQLTHDEYLTITKNKYLRDLIISPKVFFHEWLDPEAGKDSLQGDYKELAKKYYLFLQNKQPMHLLQKTQGGKKEFSIFATRDYKAGEIIGEFLGKVKYQKLEGKSKLIDHLYIDDTKYSNEFKYIYGGFPNVVCLPIENCRNSPIRFIFVTIESIKTGTQFCCNENIFAFQTGPHQELRLNELRLFASEFEEFHLLSDVEKNLSKEEFSLTLISKTEQLLYLVSRPLLIFQLILEGILTSEQAENYLINEVLEEINPLYGEIIDIATRSREYCSLYPIKADLFLLMIEKKITHEGLYKTLLFAKRTCQETVPSKIVPNVFSISRSSYQIGFFGVGRFISPNDIGQLMIRVAPTIGAVLDWSCLGSFDNRYTMSEGMRLMSIELEYFIMKNSLGSEVKMYRHNQDDDNWMTMVEFNKFAATEYHKLAAVAKKVMSNRTDRL